MSRGALPNVLRSFFVWYVAAWLLGTIIQLASMRAGHPLMSAVWFSIWYTAPFAIPAVALVVTIRREFGLGSLLGSCLTLLLGGAASWALGNWAWFYYQTCDNWLFLACAHHTSIPFPSAADGFYLASYPLYFAAVVQMARLLGVRWRTARPYILAVIPIALTSLYVGASPTHIAGIPFGLGYWTPPTVTLLQQVLAAVYMVNDSALLVMSIMLIGQSTIMAGGLFRRPIMLLVASMGSLYLADAVFLREVATDTYSDASLSNLGYALMLVLTLLTVHRFTSLARVSVSASQNTTRDVFHASAQAAVTAQSRLLGEAAWQIAASAPGISVSKHTVRLAQPYDQSLRHLGDAFRSRTGRLGRRLAWETASTATQDFTDSAARDTALAQLAPTTERQRAWSWSRVALPLATAVVWASIVAVRRQLHTHDWLVQTTLDLAPAALLIAVFLVYARRRQRLLDEQNRIAQRTNDSLTKLLEGFDEARQDERRRVAGEIHDFALQQLIGAGMHAERAMRKPGTLPEPTVDAISQSSHLISESISELRRIMDGLEPSSLFHRDLPSAIADLGAAVTAAYGLQVKLEIHDLAGLSLNQQMLIYRVISECVTNAGKHSGGTVVTVRVEQDACGLQIRVEDDGLGFPHDVHLDDEIPAQHGWGLRLLLESVLQQDGHFHVDSSAGHGTCINLVIPLPLTARQ